MSLNNSLEVIRVKQDYEKCLTHKEEVVFMLKEELHKYLTRATNFILNQEQAITEAVQLKFYKSNAVFIKKLLCFTASKKRLLCVCNVCTNT